MSQKKKTVAEIKRLQNIIETISPFALNNAQDQNIRMAMVGIIQGKLPANINTLLDAVFQERETRRSKGESRLACIIDYDESGEIGGESMAHQLTVTFGDGSSIQVRAEAPPPEALLPVIGKVFSEQRGVWVQADEDGVIDALDIFFATAAGRWLNSLRTVFSRIPHEHPDEEQE